MLLVLAVMLLVLLVMFLVAQVRVISAPGKDQEEVSLSRGSQRYEKELTLDWACCRSPFVALSVVCGCFIDPYWVQSWWKALEEDFSYHNIVPCGQLPGRSSWLSRAGKGAGFSSCFSFTTEWKFTSVVLLPLGGIRWKWNFLSLTRYEPGSC